MKTEVIESRMRKFMLLLAAFVLLGTLSELWLVGHTKGKLQFIPFILCGVGLVALAAALVRPQKLTMIALRVAMLIVALGGLLGMSVHLWKNFTSAQGVRPTTAVSGLILPALKGANPLLAPGTLVFVALLALVATYYHPALGNREAS